jgi:hypothetical protein
MQRATGLVPALQSNWLMMHVTTMIVSYAALMVGCLLSMAFNCPVLRITPRAGITFLSPLWEEEGDQPDPTSTVASISTSDLSVSSLLASENGTMLFSAGSP